MAGAASACNARCVSVSTRLTRNARKNRMTCRAAKDVTVIGFKEREFRSKKAPETKKAQLLSRVEELRLLSKAEQAGLLTLAENFGLTLGKIEQYGLLSKAESLGLIAAASDSSTPGKLSALGLALFAVGPAAVYLIPDDGALTAVQIAVAVVCAGGGAAALGASALLGDLQSKNA